VEKAAGVMKNLGNCWREMSNVRVGDRVFIGGTLRRVASVSTNVTGQIINIVFDDYTTTSGTT
jgi:hypothetical protein